MSAAFTTATSGERPLEQRRWDFGEAQVHGLTAWEGWSATTVLPPSDGWGGSSSFDAARNKKNDGARLKATSP